MPNVYDRIIKENSEFLIPIIAQWFGIDLSRTESLKDKMQRTLEAEADFCVKVLHDNPENDYIFHFEAQTTPYYSRYRGLFYRAFFSYTYNLPVRQVVAYVGDEKHYIVPKLEELGLAYEFHFVDFHHRSYREFFYKNTPEEIITAIICDLEGEDPEKIIIEILEKIQTFERHRANKCIIQLQIISNLRNLQSLVIKNIRRMPLIIDLSNDPFFVEQFEKVEAEATARGLAKGEAQGLARGEAQGLAKGEAQGLAQAIEGMLKSGRFQTEEIVEMLNVSPSFVFDIQTKLGLSPKKNGKSSKK